jgi:anti-anti-sigma factor
MHTSSERLWTHVDGPEIVVAYRDGLTILHLVGEHDMSTAQKLEARIREQVWQSRNLIVSLTDASFIDSAIVAALYRGHQLAAERGCRLVLHTQCEAIVERVLDISGLLDGIPCSDTLDGAVELAGSAPGS